MTTANVLVRNHDPVVVTDEKMFRFSRPEMERRWALVRAHLVDNDLDALIVQGYEDKTGGVSKWLTDTPAGYPRTIIFHRDALMSVIENGAQGRRRELDGDAPDHPGVGEIVTTWAFANAHYTAHLNAEATIDIVRRRGYTRVALAGVTLMPHGFVKALTDGLEGATQIVDATEFIDQCKAAKSAEEIIQIRATALTQDAVFAKLLNHIRPGMRDFEVNAFIDYQLQLMGTERGTYIGRSAPIGRPSVFTYRHFQGRTITRGDHITVLLESNGLGGLWTEIARTICFGKASQELLDGFDLCVEAQQFTADMLAPGVQASRVAERYNDYMVSRGSSRELRLYGHGMGYDMVERPLIREDETMAIVPGCNLAIHPTHTTPTMLAHVCDNFLVGLDGVGTFLHETPKQVFEL